VNEGVLRTAAILRASRNGFSPAEDAAVAIKDGYDRGSESRKFFFARVAMSAVFQTFQ